jgi:transcriptional regulator with XRE-family HTH domain
VTQGRTPISGDITMIMVRLALLRDEHNRANPESPIYQRDIAEYIGLKSKSTLSHYESGHSTPSLPVLVKWLEFWGLYLCIAEEVEQ